MALNGTPLVSGAPPLCGLPALCMSTPLPGLTAAFAPAPGADMLRMSADASGMALSIALLRTKPAPLPAGV